MSANEPSTLRAEDVDAEGAAFTLPLITARELCAQPAPCGPEQLVGPILMRGARTIIGGQTGHGKTTFAYSLVSAFVRGVDFLGWTGVGGRALIVDLEQGEQTVRRRLREVGLTDSDDVDLSLVPDGMLLNKEGRQFAELERVLAEGNYGVVLLDPFYKAHDGDANEEQHVRALMTRLDRLRATYGFALILTTHSRKPPAGGGGPMTINDIASGSGAIVRGAEIVLGVEINGPGRTRFHALKHRDGDEELPLHGGRWTLSFNREDGYRRRAADISAGARKAPAEDIAAFVRKQGNRAGPGEITDYFEISESTLRNRRAALAELGIEYRDLGKESVYVDPLLHPAPRTPQRIAGSVLAGSEAPLQAEADPAPRDPAVQIDAGSEKRSEQGFLSTPHPAPPYGGNHPPAGWALPAPVKGHDAQSEEPIAEPRLYPARAREATANPFIEEPVVNNPFIVEQDNPSIIERRQVERPEVDQEIDTLEDDLGQSDDHDAAEELGEGAAARQPLVAVGHLTPIGQGPSRNRKPTATCT